MSEYTATVEWTLKNDEAFTDGKYSRAHTWAFDGGVQIPASSAPSVVPVPYSDPAGVDPEEAFIAALSSCHMLTFLHIAAKKGFHVARYVDKAIGMMGKNTQGRTAVTRVTLRPACTFAGSRPTAEEFDALHHRAHEGCFIANSVTTEVQVEPTIA